MKLRKVNHVEYDKWIYQIRGEYKRGVRVINTRANIRMNWIPKSWRNPLMEKPIREMKRYHKCVIG